VVYKYSIRLDIWQLTLKQQEELIKSLYALKYIDLIQQLESIKQENLYKKRDGMA